MPNDFVTINNIICELNEVLSGARVEKINAPAPSDVLISLHAQSGNYKLLLSASATYPRIHITERRYENPLVPTGFLMHLRKRLTGARIDSFDTVGDDRIVKISFSGRNEMKDVVCFSLILEIAGRYSNLILVDGENVISDCMRHYSIDEFNHRLILSGATYTPMLNEKVKITDKEGLIKLFELYEYPFDRVIKTETSGLASSTIKEITRFLSEKYTSRENALVFYEQVQELLDLTKNKKAYPCNSFVPNLLGKNEVNDFFVKKYFYLDEVFQTQSVNEAADVFYSEKELKGLFVSKQNGLNTRLNKMIQKEEKKLSALNDKLSEAEGRDKYKLYGDLIINSIYMIKGGEDKIDLPDYETGNTVSVPLDKRYSPSQNAKNYYAKYNKLKRAEAQTTALIEECNEKSEYYQSISSSIKTAETKDELSDIEKELDKISVSKSKAKTKFKVKEIAPSYLTYRIKGFTVYVGRNNIQNDYVTNSLGTGGDIWLHVKNYHGGHVIIKNTLIDTVPDEILVFAAELAAYYSQARDAQRIEVDYTNRKYVKKHPSGALGQVIYTHQFSTFVKPEKHKDFIVK